MSPHTTRLALVLLAGLLAGCAGVREAPTCKGTPFVMNPERWTPTAQDMKP